MEILSGRRKAEIKVSGEEGRINDNHKLGLDHAIYLVNRSFPTTALLSCLPTFLLGVINLIH